MNRDLIFTYEKRAFRVALAVTVLGHGLAVLGLGWAGGNREDIFRPLAVMEFARFDPVGGEPGGGFGEMPAGGLEEALPAAEEVERPEPEEAAPPPEPETPTEPEPLPGLIESLFEQAAPAPSGQPKPGEEPPPLPERPKKQPQPKAKAARPAEEPGESGSSKGEGPPGQAAGGGPGSGQGGLGGGTGQGNPDAMKAYAAQVRRQLERYKKYPPAAMAKKISGQAVVSFTLNRQGVILSCALARSSGQAVLDEEVMALLKRASPLPPMPKELPQAVLALTIPIHFSVR